MCYRSTNYSIVGTDNNDNLHQLLREVSKEHFLLMGDFNYPDVNWFYHNTDADASSDSIEFMDCVNDCFLSQHVLQPTRYVVGHLGSKSRLRVKTRLKSARRRIAGNKCVLRIISDGLRTLISRYLQPYCTDITDICIGRSLVPNNGWW